MLCWTNVFFLAPWCNTATGNHPHASWKRQAMIVDPLWMVLTRKQCCTRTLPCELENRCIDTWSCQKKVSKGRAHTEGWHTNTSLCSDNHHEKKSFFSLPLKKIEFCVLQNHCVDTTLSMAFTHKVLHSHTRRMCKHVSWSCVLCDLCCLFSWIECWCVALTTKEGKKDVLTLAAPLLHDLFAARFLFGSGQVLAKSTNSSIWSHCSFLSIMKHNHCGKQNVLFLWFEPAPNPKCRGAFHAEAWSLRRKNRQSVRILHHFDLSCFQRKRFPLSLHTENVFFVGADGVLQTERGNNKRGETVISEMTSEREDHKSHGFAMTNMNYTNI